MNSHNNALNALIRLVRSFFFYPDDSLDHVAGAHTLSRKSSHR